MGSSENIEILIFIIGISGMIVLSLSIVIFFFVYQKRLYKQQELITQERLNYKDEILQATVDTQEREKQRIGRDLHDEVGTMISTALLSLDHIQKNGASSTTKGQISEVEKVLQETAQSVRNISRDLVPTLLNKLGLVDGIEGLCDRIEDNSELKIQTSLEFEVERFLDESFKLNIYRVISELLNNTLRHADAQNILIQIESDDTSFLLNYQDDGKGMSSDQISSFKGLGLKNIEGRISLLKGEMEIHNLVPTGLLFTIKIPLSYGKTN